MAAQCITTSISFVNILNFINLDPIIYVTFGIHPHETDKELLLKEDIIYNVKLNDLYVYLKELYKWSMEDKELYCSYRLKQLADFISLRVPIFISL